MQQGKTAADDGVAEIRRIAVGPRDVVIGVAASGTTPYTVAALGEARALGALAIAVANNADAPLLRAATHPILVETGEEVLAGS